MAGSAIIKEWDSNTLYLLDESIYTSTDPEINSQFHKKLFRATEQHVSDSFTTDYGNGKWEEMTVKGIKGDTGLKGATGDTGSQGIQGPAGVNGGNGSDGIFSQIATVGEAQAGVDNTKGMTPLRVQDKFDLEMVSRDTAIGTNTANINTNITNIAQNASDIAAIVIDNAQITTNQNDIAGNVIDIAQNASDIAAIVIDNAQIATNQADIATINTVSIPAIYDEINKNKAEINVIKNATDLVNASGEQELLNNQIAPVDIIGRDYGITGKGNRFELNSVGAKSARIRVEIYRKDDAETRFTIAHLELQFNNVTNQWMIGRFATTVLSGLDDGLTFGVTTSNPGAGIYVGQVNYVSDDMVGGNYDPASYVRFLLEEIREL